MTLSGLYTTSSNSGGAAREQLPLDGVHVAVRIVNLVAEVQVVQFYVNDRDTNIDCVYEFPMDDSAAVCGLEVELNDRFLIGEVREKNEAIEEYSRAISQGQTAALVEEDKPDIFRQSIGNIPPQSRVNVRITYVTELKVDKETGGAIFVLPTSVAPRYTPYNSMPIGFATRWQDVCFGRRLSYSPGGNYTSINDLPFSKWSYVVPTFIVDRERPTAFSLTLEAEMPSRVLSLESRTHQLKVEPSASLPSENITAASLFNEQEAMGKDLEVIIYQEKPFEPSVQLEVLPDGSGCAMMTFVPEFETEAAQMEIVFVVDCSGSMSGSRIQAAKRALEILVQSLPLSCTFNIVRFGSEFDSLFGQPQPYSQTTLNEAREFIQQTDANMGGTEILHPLQNIVNTTVTLGGSRQVFVLTDGQVSNTEQVIQLLRLNAHNTRVFTVGIGDEVSRHLVEGMARASAGTAEFILGKDLSGQHSGNLDSKLIHQLKLATLPSITKIDVDWLGGASQPTAAPDAQGPTSKFFPTGPSRRHPGSMTRTGQSSAPNVSAHQVGSGQWLNSGSDASFAQPQGRNASLYQAPFLPPPLFSGYKYIMYCFFKPDEMAGVSQVNVSALVPGGGGDLFLAVPITKVTSVGRTVHLLGARALIKDLTEGTSHLHFRKSFGNKARRTQPSFIYSAFSGWLNATTGTPPQDRATAWDLVPINPPHEIVRSEMIEIGTRFGIVSRETALVAVERWSDGRTGMAYRAELAPPPQILYGSGFMDGGSYGAGFMDGGSYGAGFMDGGGSDEGRCTACLCFPFVLVSALFGGVASWARSCKKHTVGALQKRAPPKSAAPQGAGLPTSSSPTPSPTSLHDAEKNGTELAASSSPAPSSTSLHDVVKIQNFDGSVDVNETNTKIMGFPNVESLLSLEVCQDIRKEIPNPDLASSLFFAIVFLTLLKQQFQSDVNKWTLVANKTRSWLNTTLVHVSESEANQLVESWLEKARQTIQFS